MKRLVPTSTLTVKVELKKNLHLLLTKSLKEQEHPKSCRYQDNKVPLVPRFIWTRKLPTFLTQ